MPRPYHSSSSLKLGQRCARAWAYRYVAGLRETEKPWLAFGKAGHAVFEAYYEGRAPDWSSPAGQVAHRGAHYLPHPAHCVLVEVERGIGSEPLAVPAMAHGGAIAERPLTTCLTAHGIRLAGFRDLLVEPDSSEVQRLSLPAMAPITHDYKFVADVRRSALTPEDLAADVQAAAYALDACDRFATSGHWCRWVYFQKRGAALTLPVLARITRDQALEALAEPARVARELDTLTRIEDAPMNPAACEDFGGCGYHVTAGGPCSAQRSFGALIQARTRKDQDNMTAPVGLSPETLAKFGAIAAPAPAPIAAPAFVAPPPVVTFAAPVAVSSAPAEAPPAEPAKRGRKPKPAEAPPPPAVAVAPVAPAPAAGGKGATLVALSTQLAEAEAHAIAAQQRVAQLHAEIASVLAA